MTRSNNNQNSNSTPQTPEIAMAGAAYEEFKAAAQNPGEKTLSFFKR